MVRSDGEPADARRKAVHVLIVFGTRGRLSTTSSGTFFCPRCRGDRTYELRSARRWFTLFFVPVFPISPPKPLGARCTTCTATFAPQVLTLPTSEAMRGQMLRSFRQCAAAVIAAGDATSAVSRACALGILQDLDPGVSISDEALEADVAAADPSQLAVYVSPVANRLDPRQAESFYAACVKVALADGPLSPGERDALRNLGTSLNLSEAHQLGVLESLRAPSERAVDGPEAG